MNLYIISAAVVVLSTIFFVSLKYLKKILNYYNNKLIDPIYLSKNKNINYNIHFFTDKKIAITGVFKKFNSRNEVARLLWDQGAVIDTTFNSNTDYLIVGTYGLDAVKVKSAFYLNIKVLTEDELLRYFSVSDLITANKETVLAEQN